MPTTAPDALLLGFGRALRASGLAVTADREAGFLEAVSVVGLDDEHATYWAGRATLCSGPDDTARYDRVFTSWFSGLWPDGTGPLPRSTVVTQAPLTEDGTADAAKESAR